MTEYHQTCVNSKNLDQPANLNCVISVFHDSEQSKETGEYSQLKVEAYGLLAGCALNSLVQCKVPFHGASRILCSVY